jgi:hypothetical protein
VALSCPARLVADRVANASVLVLTPFGSESAVPEDAMVRIGAQARGLGLPRAEERDPYYASFRSRAYGRTPDDEAWVNRVADALTEIGRAYRPSEVYAPLGVGGHIDHRLCHEAALRAFEGRDGRNLFFYEERPEALVRGAVRMRLAQLGAQLPPGAAEAALPTSLGSFLLRFHLAPRARGELAGWSDVLRSAGAAARAWRGSRQWRPLRSVGPRLQPLVHQAESEQMEKILALPAGRIKRAKRLERLGLAYARALGGRDHAERYWLLLPAREIGGQLSA